MSVTIGNARIDENGKAHGGAAGDSTGKEVMIQNWYSFPWDTVLIPKDSSFAERLAMSMEYACANNNIGYDQYQRTTLYAAVKALGWSPANLRSVSACETDCSALIAVCCNAAAGKEIVSKDIYTGNEAAALVNSGYFTKTTDSKYLNSSAYLTRGMVLLNTTHHTAMVLSNGSSASTTTTPITSNTYIDSYDAVCNAAKFYGKVRKWSNGSTDETVYCDTKLKNNIGVLDAYEKCVCVGKMLRYIVVYKIDGKSSYKCGFVDYAGTSADTEATVLPTSKKWTNNNSVRIVYADTGKVTKVGSVDPNEQCYCVGKIGNYHMIYYKVDGTTTYKVGFVDYNGGI